MSCFIYFGHFYRLAIGGVEYSCRSTLEIVSSSCQALAAEAVQDPGMLLDRQPDAVVVMLNPGGSYPCDCQEPTNCITSSQIDDDARSNLVLTRPDATQTEIEKVMADRQFSHVRVLNLFDIREKESKELIGRVRESLNLKPRHHLNESSEMIKPYSIFSTERSGELVNRLNAINSIVVAWGTVKGAIKFYKKCHTRLSETNIRVFGWPAEGADNSDRKFYHPGRKKGDGWHGYIINNWPDEE